MTDTPLDARLAASNHLGEGRTWEADIFGSLRRSRTVAWIIAAIAITVALVSLALVAMLLPLKTFEPYVVTVDKTTGYLEIARPLKQGPLEPAEAITVANVVRYIKARETYDYRMIKENFELAALLSNGPARDDLVRLWATGNPQRPDKVLGRDAAVAVFVKSASFLNVRTIQVRFDTIEKTLEREISKHWVATVKFRYTSEPEKNAWRFDNPLGFQAMDYRRDQEAFSTTNDPNTAGGAAR
jgi:type IV secretion system protein VirB8